MSLGLVTACCPRRVETFCGLQTGFLSPSRRAAFVARELGISLLLLRPSRSGETLSLTILSGAQLADLALSLSLHRRGRLSDRGLLAIGGGAAATAVLSSATLVITTRYRHRAGRTSEA